jgi:hypothetical protein
MAERKNKGLGMKISKLLKVLKNIAFSIRKSKGG